MTLHEFLVDYAENHMLDAIKKDLREAMRATDYAEFLKSDEYLEIRSMVDVTAKAIRNG